MVEGADAAGAGVVGLVVHVHVEAAGTNLGRTLAFSAFKKLPTSILDLNPC